MTNSSLAQALILGLSNTLASLIGFLPQLLAALGILAIGYFLGKWVKVGLIGVMRRSSLAQVAKKSRVGELLAQVNMPFDPAAIVGELAQWLVLLIFAIAAIQTLGLVVVSDILTQVVGFLPRLAVATIVFLGGVILAGWVEAYIKRVLVRLDAPTARLLAKAGSYATVILAGLVALSELGIATSFVQLLFAGVVAGFALAFGLAVGLGSKDLVKQVLEQWYSSRKK